VTFTQVIEREPEMVTDDDDDVDPDMSDEEKNNEIDLVDILVGGTAMYAEWKHIDGIFEGLYETIPGRYIFHWAGSNPEEDHFEPRT
jgi:hypothetical protein